MTDPKVVLDWYQALDDTDCKRLMELLEVDESLVKLGWKSEPSRIVYGRPWDGCTVLHAGARRGCPELIKQVLKLYNVTIVDRDSNAAELGAATISSTKSPDGTARRPGQSDLVEREITERKVSTPDNSPPDDAVSEGDQKHAGLTTGSTHTGLARLKRVVSTIILSNRKSPVDDKSQEKARTSAGRLGRKLTNDTLSILQVSAGDSDHSLHPPRDQNSNLDTTSNDSVLLGLSDLLVMCYGADSGLHALTMAMQHGNEELTYLLFYAENQCEPPFPSFNKFVKAPSNEWFLNEFPRKELKETDRTETHNRVRLRNTTREFIDEFDDTGLMTGCLKAYDKDRDFNFLPPLEYLCGYPGDTYESVLMGLWKKIRWSGGELWRFLLGNFQDGQGRPPFHVAVDLSTIKRFEKLFVNWDGPGDKDREVIICAMTTPDAAGRTPLHRAASNGRTRWGRVTTERTKDILRYCDTYEEVYATCHVRWVHKMDETHSHINNQLRESQGSRLGRRQYQDYQTPWQVAIIHKNFDAAQLLIEKSRNNEWQHRGYGTGDAMWSGVREWDVMQLARLVGITPSFAKFLKGKGLMKEFSTLDEIGRVTDNGHTKHPYHPVHLVASSGDYKMLKYFIDDLQCDPFIEDFEGNNLLHHALKVKYFVFETHFLDYVNYDDFFWANDRPQIWSLGMNEEDVAREVFHETHIAQRQGCINNLLQAGCDIFKANKNNEVSYPMDFLSRNGKFLSWWYNIQVDEFKATQNNLNFAGNAIAVTAALVATASYVGPLQPPLGYGVDSNQLQDGNIWVLMFILFDTTSFYLAITAITVSLIPSLPIPQQAMRDELQRTRGMVALAVGILFPSIIFVFGAFACGSLAVVSSDITSSTGGRLLLASTCNGGLICTLGFLLFFSRLLAFVFPRNKWVKGLYEITKKIRSN